MVLTALSVFLLCALLGAVVGVFAGLLGIGGGLIIVPALVYLLPLFGINIEVAMPIALATSMASIIVTTVSSARAHHKSENVPWNLVKFISAGVAIGAVSGAFIADQLSTETLKTIFAGCVFVLSAHMLIHANKIQERPFPGRPWQLFIGSVVGVIASLMGISGGLVLIPLVHYLGLDLRRSIGCGAGCGIVASIMGTVGFIGVGLDNPDLPDLSLGYIYLPALFGIVATSAFSAPVGVKLANKLQVAMLKKIFAVFLVIVGLNMALF